MRSKHLTVSCMPDLEQLFEQNRAWAAQMSESSGPESKPGRLE